MRRCRWQVLWVAVLAGAGAPADAAAAEPDDSAPSPATSPSTPSTSKPASAQVKRTFLALPFVGVHSYRNDQAGQYGPGLRIGAVLGGRFSDRVSLNGEVRVDFSNPRGVPTFQERAYHVAFKPMIDIPAGAVEVVLGLKLGVFLLRHEEAVGDLVEASDTTGFGVGLDGGLFVPISVQTSVGLLLSYDLMGGSSTCVQGAGAGGGPLCSPATSEALGLSAGVLF